MFENYKDSLFNDKIIIKSQQRFRNYNHKVYTEEVNKIALTSNDDKRLQTYDKVTAYPYGTPAIKVCESEILSKNKLSRPDEDKDKTTIKTKTKIEDKDTIKGTDKTLAKTKTKTEDKDKAKDKDKAIIKLRLY